MTRSLVPLGVALVLMGSMAACSDSGTTLAPTSAATPTVAGTPTAATDEPAGSSGEPHPTVEPVDLVVMAASGGAGVPERYGPVLAEALDREVRVHPKIWARPTEVLSGTEGSYADVVAGAEAILLYFPPGGYEPPSFLTCLDALDAMGDDPDYSGPTWSPGQTWEPPEVTTAEDWHAWRDALDREYEAIWTLRKGQPTIIRGYGYWGAWIPKWRQIGIEAECTAGEEAIDQVMREAAEAAGAVYVSMLDVFRGPGHDRDTPPDLLAEDGWHLSDAGVDVLVEALAAAGFEVNEPPS